MQNQFEIENGILKAYLAPDAEVVIPEGVHTIGDGVFKGMSWITSVTLPSSLKKIGAFAFKGCRKLGTVKFPDGLEEIGEYAFHRCHDIEEMIFPKTVTCVGNHAFLYCDGVKKVVLEGPDKLGRAALSHNLSLQEIYLNRNLDDSNFADEVFEGCVRLTKITLSGEAFEVSNLIEAMDSGSTYPGIIKSIARSVYHSLQIEDGVLLSFNINLKSISLPEGITAIGKGCFFDKKGIVNITLPESLREIRANAFLNCTSLEEVTLLNEDVVLDGKAFRGCCNLKMVNIAGNSFLLEDEIADGLAGRIREQVLGDFYISGKLLVRYTGNEEQVRIPKEVEMIGERCFFGNERVKAVTCPDGLLEIREQAFAGCVTLQNIVMPEGLKRIEREAFAECKKLLKCSLPKSLEYIGEYAFRRCFTLPLFDQWPEKAIINPYAFYRAKNFSNITPAVNGTESLSENDIYNDGDIRPYANARKGGIRVLELSGIKRIGKYAYASCPDLEEVIIDAPECVIGQGAFSRCPKLKKAYLHVKEMGEGIFSYCRSLVEASLPGITVLPAESFAGCYSLYKFEAKDITRMGARCFDECIGLNSFDFSGIRMIGERAFERCDSLKNVKLDKVECGYHAFADCSSLESVTISMNTVLKSGAFIGCTQIRTVSFDSAEYKFSRFSDSLNHVGNPCPGPVRELIASVYSSFEISDGRTLAGYRQDATAVTVPRDIEEIGQDVFRDHVRLKEIHIPASVKIFGSHAFSQTPWLDGQRQKSDMLIVNDVLIDGAFCKGKVVIPAYVKRIASWCFAGNTDIQELEIPSERIAIEALSFRNCINLRKITDWYGNEYALNSVSDMTEAGYPELIQRIFSECINCFKLDSDGILIESTGNIANLRFPLGIKSIGEGVYKDCHLLESIALADDTESIGRSAFENSKWLKMVTNAHAVKIIGALAFSGCQSLESVDLSDSLEELGYRCFEHCSCLSGITLSDKLGKIPERAFFRCKSLKKIYIPKSVKVIEAEAFAFCTGLEEVYIPDQTVIAEKAFEYCDQVKIFRGEPNEIS